MGYTDKNRRRAFGAAAVSIIALIAAAGPAVAQAADAVDAQEFSIGQGPLADALRAISLRTGVPIIFSESVVAGRATSGVTGYYGTQTALAELLRGSGLEAVPGAGGYVIRVQATDGVGAPEQPSPARSRQPERVPVPSRAGAPGEEADLRIDRVTVTGTSLRGIAPESSPLQIYSREDILGSGVATTEQFIRTLPQNFGGGSTEFAGRLPNDTNSQRNDTLGTGANLRGLGAGATLTLLNGSRMAPASGIGDFVDLSMIPMLAIERVEVLTDGASAVYGGDAVAGVVNFVLRDDFDGAETSLRYGTVTRGDMAETRIGQTLGRSWAGGNVLGTFEHYQRDNLLLSDRPAIPAPTLQSGQPISNTDTFDLLPKQRRNSGILSLRQKFGPRLEVQATGLYSRRNVNNTQVNSIGSNFVGNTRGTAEAATLNFAGDYVVSDTWVFTAEASYSEMRNEFRTRTLAPVATEGNDFRTVSDMWTAGLRASGDLFQLPGGIVAAAIGTQYREETLISQAIGFPAGRDGRRDVTALFAEVQVPLVGDDNALPFIQRLEVNLSGRIDDYSDFGRTSNPRVGVLWSPGGDFRARGSYSTSYAPPALGLTGAIDRGGGVISYDFVRNLLGIPLPDPSLAGVNFLSTSGTSDGLGPESSRAYSFGFDQVLDRDRHGFRISATWYDIEFDGRLGATPIPGNLNANFAPGLAFSDPSLFPSGTIIFFPSQDEIDAVLASLQQPLRFLGGATAVENIGFISNVLLVRNLASTTTSGIDLDFGYELDTGGGRLVAGLNANYITAFDRQAAATTPSVEARNTLFNPVNLKLRGRTGYVWGGFSAHAFVNYTDAYKTDDTPAAKPIGSWTTVDLSLAYHAGKDSGWLSGTGISLSATNLFDTPPPVTPPFSNFRLSGYDPTNASPVGRFVAIELRKAF